MTPEDVWKQINGLTASVRRHKRRAALANIRADEAQARARDLEVKLAKVRAHVSYLRLQLNRMSEELDRAQEYFK